LLTPLRFAVIVLVASAVILSGYEIYSLGEPPGTVTSAVPSSFTVNGRTFVFNYTATTNAERLKGLMNTTVTSSTTMLFAFPSFGLWPFWMYDTNTSLDMIWLNATGTTATVVYVVSGATPCYDKSACPLYTPTSAANYVIEAKAGFAAANGIAVGTTVRLS
jgi:uncharacterized membrane protein (UPF0127 family)